MKIAIVGAGFAGLSAAWHLSRDHKVYIFDAQGIGAGASGASTGLLHPYPGEKGRLSWKADEAMDAARTLLKISEGEMGRPVANYAGILKQGICLNPGPDVEKLGEDLYFIRSGITVFVRPYLEGLWKACEKKGAKLKIQTIETLQELEEFDAVIICAGAGIRNFPECRHLKINFVKGQALVCKLEEPMERSVVAKQYVALTERPDICHLGATYERDFTSAEPDLETAVKLLQPKTEVVECRSGVRVTNPAHYFPIVEKIDAKTWAVTALGSRGLLYHGYLGQLLTQVVLSA
jgi:glycine/D-amino acid oxidase-like deaminating enzyme